METFADLIVVNAPARNKHVVKEVGVTFADYLVTLLFFYHIMLQKTSAGQNVFEASNLMACSYGCIYEGAEFTTTRYSTESVQIAIEGGCMPVSRSIKDAHPTAYTYPTGPQPSLLKIFTHCYCIIVSSPSTRKSNLHSTAIWCCVWHTRLIRRRIAVGPENLWIRVVLVLSTIIYLILGHTTCAKFASRTPSHLPGYVGSGSFRDLDHGKGQAVAILILDIELDLELRMKSRTAISI